MRLPINMRWDLSVKARVVLTHRSISDRDISNEAVKAHPVEIVDYELVIPYPLARHFMERLEEIVRAYPEGVKLTCPHQ